MPSDKEKPIGYCWRLRIGPHGLIDGISSKAIIGSMSTGTVARAHTFISDYAASARITSPPDITRGTAICARLARLSMMNWSPGTLASYSGRGGPGT